MINLDKVPHPGPPPSGRGIDGTHFFKGIADRVIAEERALGRQVRTKRITREAPPPAPPPSGRESQ